MAAESTLPPPDADTLKAFAGRRNNQLWNVVALLHAVEDRIEVARTFTRKSNDEAHQTFRLVQMARERIDEIANEPSLRYLTR